MEHALDEIIDHTTIEREIDNYLAFLYLCEEQPKKTPVKLQEMDGAYPILTSLKKGMKFIINDEEPAVWPVRSVIAAPTKTESGWREGSLQFTSVETISLPLARKRGATIFSSKMAKISSVVCTPDGKYESGDIITAFINNHWTGANKTQWQTIGPESREMSSRHMAIGMSVALSTRYEWSVWIGYGDGPRIRLMTDPQGTMSFFRLRDISPGATRRAALRNWVSDHWHKNRSDRDAQTWIARHLRGSTEFSWNGMRIKIQAPEYDTEILLNKKAARL